MSSLKITNALGRYDVKKTGGTWHLVFPRKLQARQDFVQEIIDALRNISVQRLHDKDKINLQSFSLHNPTSTIELKTPSGQTKQFKIGLFNTADNTTYITDEQSSKIYQINAPKVALQSLGLSDFINSSLFNEFMGKTQRIEITKYPSKRRPPTLTLIQKEDSWTDVRKRKLNNQKVQTLLEKLLSHKAKVILDKRPQRLEKYITRTMKNPFFSVAFFRSEKDKSVYKFSYPLRSVPGMKVKKKELILVTSSEREHPFLADKSILALLNTKTSRMR